jgi:hypothetical protein
VKVITGDKIQVLGVIPVNVTDRTGESYLLRLVILNSE